MKQAGSGSLPLYPEGRPCTRPTTRQVIDVFEPLMHRMLNQAKDDDIEIFTTELSPIHRMILKLLGIPATEYGA